MKPGMINSQTILESTTLTSFSLDRYESEPLIKIIRIGDDLHIRVNLRKLRLGRLFK